MCFVTTGDGGFLVETWQWRAEAGSQPNTAGLISAFTYKLMLAIYGVTDMYGNQCYPLPGLLWHLHHGNNPEPTSEHLCCQLQQSIQRREHCTRSAARHRHQQTWVASVNCLIAVACWCTTSIHVERYAREWICIFQPTLKREGTKTYL